MLTIIVDKATGKQKRVYLPSDAPEIRNTVTEEAVQVPEFTAEPSSREYRWDAATKAYVALPGAPTFVISRTKLSKREFLNRVGKTTLGQINAIIITPITAENAATQVPLVAQLMTMKDFLNAVPDVELDHPDTITFCEGLVALTLKTEAEKVIMLTPSTVLSEQ